MKEDNRITRRRLLIAGAAAVGAAGAAGVLGAFPSGEPPPAPGPAAGAGTLPTRPSAPRLRPLAGHGAPGVAPLRAPVRREPLLRVEGHRDAMVLTFDDGPDPRHTPEILDILAAYEVPAMFFVCGEMAAAHPDLMARMADDGHVVGNHTWSHPLLTRLDRSRIRIEIERTCEIIDRSHGAPPLWFRAPYGAWNRAAFQLGAEMGMEPLAWTLDTLDWTTPGTGTIVERVREGAGPGVVVLSHDAGGDRSQSVRALRTYLPQLLDSGHRLTVPRRRYL
ncbi:polysaccharide deacetylase family protein [Streptomyces sp. HSG2]|uniref:polysaccharide deacetylase family protein n=1 Tax=Streptomyces sp. HSG2 TaxID=2797167 RepID=UPI001905DC5C|nr:polysaccharide deacetylase family protein [Streptomyces sp. HSG2]